MILTDNETKVDLLNNEAIAQQGWVLYNNNPALLLKDLAMQLVLPELDGRIGGLLVGHKADAVWHARTQCPLTRTKISPSAATQPMFSERPKVNSLFLIWTMRAPCRWAISSVPSVDPESTSTTSMLKSDAVCPATPARSSSR